MPKERGGMRERMRESAFFFLFPPGLDAAHRSGWTVVVVRDEDGEPGWLGTVVVMAHVLGCPRRVMLPRT